MTIHYQDTSITLHHGDCLDVLRSLPDASVDAVVTDPPYGLANTDPAHVADTIVRWVNGDRDYLPGGKGFMGKAWDAFVPPVAVWDDCLRVLKPGGHVLAFAGSRTVDLMTLGLRLAGFDIRDSVAWLYGSGFPKSLDVSKAIDRDNGRKFEDRFALGRHIRECRTALGLTAAEVNAWFGYRDGCQHWERQDRSGARVPTLADWHVLRERLGLSDEFLPLVERVEAERAKIGETAGTQPIAVGFGPTYGNGTERRRLDITAPATPDAERWQGWGTALKPAFEPIVVARKPLVGTVAANVLTHGTGALNIDGCRVGDNPGYSYPNGRGGSEPHHMQRGERNGIATEPVTSHAGRWPANVVLDETQAAALDEQANASRFFYVAKAPKRERPNAEGIAHPTVKPLALMRWLVRLVTPPGGTVLEPFAGSGTTVEASLLEGFHCIAVEREADYLPLIRQRIERHRDQPYDGGLFELNEGGAA